MKYKMKSIDEKDNTLYVWNKCVGESYIVQLYRLYTVMFTGVVDLCVVQQK
jgi:hypothetical protein